MKKIYITQRIPEIAEKMLRDAGYEVDVNPENKIFSKQELIEALKQNRTMLYFVCLQIL